MAAPVFDPLMKVCRPYSVKTIQTFAANSRWPVQDGSWDPRLYPHGPPDNRIQLLHHLYEGLVADDPKAFTIALRNLYPFQNPQNFTTMNLPPECTRHGLLLEDKERAKILVGLMDYLYLYFYGKGYPKGKIIQDKSLEQRPYVQAIKGKHADIAKPRLSNEEVARVLQDCRGFLRQHDVSIRRYI
ncbi:hypothetical protein M011DRAFT_458707 [Sporormia fimetaria CBS 119925]|uniref:Uncharacterized protein n=1 Tax=Sporormia fimetaria CBS 119925 TaxID=1340428 RepID=A0A6A6VAC0_9PLEO|nr:hypothetical protein M011DRAFT_458707 [Sporormia fimetaria CBS 119925]